MGARGERDPGVVVLPPWGGGTNRHWRNWRAVNAPSTKWRGGIRPTKCPSGWANSHWVHSCGWSCFLCRVLLIIDDRTDYDLMGAIGFPLG